MAANISDPCATPLMPNPSGAPPNFVSREMFEPTAIGIITTFMVLATISVVLRVAGTLRKEHKLFIDDCMFQDIFC